MGLLLTDGGDLGWGRCLVLGMLHLRYLRHPSGAVELAVGYLNLRFRREGWAADVHLRVISNWVVFEAMAVNDINRGLSVGTEKIND